MNILVRNLPRHLDEHDLQDLFEPFGTISEVNIVMDQRTGESKGFGFVNMPIANEGKAAIKALNNRDIEGERIRVKVSKAIRK